MDSRIDDAHRHRKLEPVRSRMRPLSRQACWRALMKLFADLAWRMR